MENTIELMTKDKFDKVLVKFLLDEPFFSTIIRHMKKEMTFAIPTAGVAVNDGSICLYWNPDFIGSLETKKIFGLLKHECYHLIFKHVTTRKRKPHLLWNIATDLAINSIIPERELPEGGLIPGKKFSNVESLNSKKEVEQAQKLSNFISKLPKNKSSEWYMETLLSDDDLQKDFEEYFSKGNGENNEGYAGMDVHFDPDGMSESDKELIEGKVKQIVKKAAEKSQLNNSWGTVPQEVRKKILSGLSDAVDWKRTLQYFCGTKQKANKTRTMRKINRKYPYIHAGRKTKHTSNLAIYIDQSGSVGDNEIAMFFATLNDLARDVSFTVYHFDYTVDERSKYNWRKGKKFNIPYRTRSGGTCFDSVETHFRKISKEYDGYIVMTDGCAPKPKTCISKRCWVILPGYNLYFNPDNRDSIVLMQSKGT